MYYNYGDKLPEKMEIKTINYIAIIIGLLITIFIFSSIKNISIELKITLNIISFFLLNYLFRGKLILKLENEFINLTWDKKPLLSRFKNIKIKLEDILYTRFQTGYKNPDSIKIISKKFYLDIDISFLDKNNIETEIIKPLKSFIKSHHFGENLIKEKKQSSYFKRVDLMKRITLIFAKLCLVIFIILISVTLATKNLINPKSILYCFLFVFLLFIIYGISRLSLARFIHEDDYKWLK